MENKNNDMSKDIRRLDGQLNDKERQINDITRKMKNIEDDLQRNNRSLDEKINRCEKKIIDFETKYNQTGKYLG
jgi:predicted  nucleic acid-binding Zn-ribbon protein